MACFIVPATEAVVTTVVTKVVEKKEKENTNLEASTEGKELFSSKLKRLNGLLWGGSALLAFEHLWHGEIQPFFPFLTAAASKKEALCMIKEMSTVGVTMAAVVTVVWGIMTFATASIMKKNTKLAAKEVEK